MRHDRHYTLDEARELRAWVGARVDEARAALEALSRPDVRQALRAVEVDTGGLAPAATVPPPRSGSSAPSPSSRARTSWSAT